LWLIARISNIGRWWRKNSERYIGFPENKIHYLDELLVGWKFVELSTY
jgi:hypothetical protein